MGMNKTMRDRMWAGVTGVTPKTFRIVCEEIGFIPKTVQILIQGKVIQVFGLVKVKLESGITTTKEFCKAYQLPHYVLSSKYTILFSEHGHLLIDFPILTDTRAYPGAGGQFEESNDTSDAEWKNPETECLSISIYKSAPKTGRFPKSNAYKRMGMGNADVDEYSMPQWNMSKRVPSSLTGANSWDESKFASNSANMGYKNFGF